MIAEPARHAKPRHGGADIGGGGGEFLEQVLDECERVALALQIIVETVRHRRAAVLGAQFGNLLRGEPVGADNALIERAVAVVFDGAASKGEAQVSNVVMPRLGLINADQRIGLNLPAAFFESFAPGGVQQGFAVFQVSRWLVVTDALAGMFFHQQKASVAFHHRGDRDIRLPALHRAT